MNTWISVNKKLPYHGQTVFVHYTPRQFDDLMDYSRVGTAKYKHYKKKNREPEWQTEEHSFTVEVNYIDYWMTVPQLPELHLNSL